jgi:ribonucleotide monophosphatase NagD (HAD superfamily)
MGRAEGWSKVLVLSGVTEDPAATPDDLRPDLVVDSIVDLPEALAEAAAS